MDISGHTEPFAVLGHPIGHSLSPVMHNASLAALGKDAIYLAFDVHPDRLMGVLPAMRDMGFRGVNLTVPLKEVAFRGIEDLADSAQRLGAVNTVEFRGDGTMRGHNTDGDGFLIALDEAFNTSVAGLSVFVLGCGGAGRAVALSCAAAGAARLALADVEGDRMARLADEVEAIAGDRSRVHVAGTDRDDWESASRKSDLIIHATPVGMKKDDPPILPPDAFRQGQLAFDLIYMYPETSFTKAARAGEAQTANGLGMLLHQGAKAFNIWTGEDADINAMRAALEGSVYGT